MSKIFTTYDLPKSIYKCCANLPTGEQMRPNGAILVNYALGHGGTRAIVTLCNTLNKCGTIRKTAKALGAHESQISRVASQIFVRTYSLHPDLVVVFENLRAMEAEEHEHFRHQGQLLPFTSPGHQG